VYGIHIKDILNYLMYETVLLDIGDFPVSLGLLISPGVGDIAGIDKNATIQAFEEEGFQVQEGKISKTDSIGLYEAGIAPSCYGIIPPAHISNLKSPKLQDRP
jgi:hypothetical protein